MTLATLEDTRERAALAPYAEAVHDAIGASMAPNTRRAYRTQWAAFTTWADGRGVQSLPAAPETLAAYLAARAEADGLKLATLKGMAAAVGAAHKAAGLDNPADSEGVRCTLKGLGRKVGAPQRQAPGLTADAMAAVRATARLPRRGRGGILESAEAASCQGRHGRCPTVHHARRSATPLRGRSRHVGRRGRLGRRFRAAYDPAIED